MGDGGGPGWLLPGEQPRARGAVAGAGHVGVRLSARRSGRLLPSLSLGRAQRGAAGGLGRGAARLPSCRPPAQALRPAAAVDAQAPDTGAVPRTTPHVGANCGGRLPVALRRGRRGPAHGRPLGALRPGGGRLPALPRHAAPHEVLPSPTPPLRAPLSGRDLLLLPKWTRDGVLRRLRDAGLLRRAGAENVGVACGGGVRSGAVGSADRLL